MGTSGRLRTHFHGAFGFDGTTIEEIAHLLAATPELAQSVTRLKLRGSSGALSIKEGPSLVEILGACFNVEDLHFNVTRSTLDVLAASRIRLDRLHSLRMECFDPDPDAFVLLLTKMPNITRDDPYLGLILAAGRTRLRALTLFAPLTPPDLSSLTALTRLHIKITRRGPTPPEGGFHYGLARFSRLRPLDVTCVDVALDSLFAAVAALGPRLSSLTIHVVGTRGAAGQALAEQLVPLIRGPLTRLRDLGAWVEFVDDDIMRLLTGEVGGACRSRRVLFLLKNYAYE